MVSTISPQVQDEFSSEEFNGSSASFPWLMVLTKPKHYGFFVTQEQAEIAGWHDYRVYSTHTHELKDGTELQGFKIPNPRMLVLASGEMLRTSEEDGVCGKWVKGDRERGYRPVQRYLLMFLDENNKPLHDTPFGWTAKGVMMAQFSLNLQNFRRDFEDAWAKSRNERKTAKNARFHALTVFNFECGSEMKGEGANKNNACIIKSYVKPTPETIGNYFIGYDAELKERVFALVDENQGYGNWEASESEEYTPPAAVPEMTPFRERIGKIQKMVKCSTDELKAAALENGLPDHGSKFTSHEQVNGLRSALFMKFAASKIPSNVASDSLYEALAALEQENDDLAAWTAWLAAVDALAPAVAAPNYDDIPF